MYICPVGGRQQPRRVQGVSLGLSSLSEERERAHAAPRAHTTHARVCVCVWWHAVTRVVVVCGQSHSKEHGRGRALTSGELSVH